MQNSTQPWHPMLLLAILFSCNAVDLNASQPSADPLAKQPSITSTKKPSITSTKKPSALSTKKPSALPDKHAQNIVHKYLKALQSGSDTSDFFVRGKEPEPSFKHDKSNKPLPRINLIHPPYLHPNTDPPIITAIIQEKTQNESTTYGILFSLKKESSKWLFETIELCRAPVTGGKWTVYEIDWFNINDPKINPGDKAELFLIASMKPPLRNESDKPLSWNTGKASLAFKIGLEYLLPAPSPTPKPSDATHLRIRTLGSQPFGQDDGKKIQQNLTKHQITNSPISEVIQTAQPCQWDKWDKWKKDASDYTYFKKDDVHFSISSNSAAIRKEVVLVGVKKDNSDFAFFFESSNDDTMLFGGYVSLFLPTSPLTFQKTSEPTDNTPYKRYSYIRNNVAKGRTDPCPPPL